MTNVVTDPYSGLKLVELSHVWGHGVPSYPGQADVKMHRAVKHAEHGVLAWKCNTVMHTGTHMNAPINMIQQGADLARRSRRALLRQGVVLDIPKGSFEVITRQGSRGRRIKVRTGRCRRHRYRLAPQVFGRTGVFRRVARIEQGRGAVAGGQGMQVRRSRYPADRSPACDLLGPHRGGPTMRRLAESYTRRPARTRRSSMASGTLPTRPCWAPAFRPSSRSAATWTCCWANARLLSRRHGDWITVMPARSG